MSWKTRARRVRAQACLSFAPLAVLGVWSARSWAQQALPPAAVAPLPGVTPPVERPAEKPWFDLFKIEAFVDGYASYNYKTPRPQAGANLYRAFDSNNGFALAWAGIDVEHALGPVGATLNLRFGPSASTYAGADAQHGLENVKQAFATLKPVQQLTIDFGKFDTLVGAEVADSQKNFNYTRGALYWLGQPLFHTGLRATWQPHDVLSFKAMVANGWNRSIDNNVGKTLGAQVGVTPSSRFAAYLSWIGGPEQDEVVSCAQDEAYAPMSRTCVPSPGVPASSNRNNGANTRWRHLVDLVVQVNPVDALGFVLNGDWATETVIRDDGRERAVQWMGGALGARYSFLRSFAAAARAEWYWDKDGATSGAKDLTLYTGTITLEAKPSDWLIVRLENRADVASGEVFHRNVHGATGKTQFTSLLGLVVSAGRTWKRGP